VIATVMSKPTCVLMPAPLRLSISSTMETANELTIATTSLQALIRHQNQRRR
jgi:hypothetical protein